MSSCIASSCKGSTSTLFIFSTSGLALSQSMLNPLLLTAEMSCASRTIGPVALWVFFLECSLTHFLDLKDMNVKESISTCVHFAHSTSYLQVLTFFPPSFLLEKIFVIFSWKGMANYRQAPWDGYRHSVFYLHNDVANQATSKYEMSGTKSIDRGDQRLERDGKVVHWK